MKRSLLSFLLCLFIAQFSNGQNATNFTCDDCAGQNHDLFSELDEGKVIVLCWVMPCGPCQGPSLTTFNVVKSFEDSHPDQVFMYLIDDYGDTKCGPLNSWAKDKGLSGATIFSDASIDMADYGAFGMPKIVVVGGADYQVFYQSDFAVDANQLQAGITDALITIPTTNIKSKNNSFTIYPNPAISEATIKVYLAQETEIQIQVFSSIGQKVLTLNKGQLKAGDQSIIINTSKLLPGNYTVQIAAEKFKKSAMLKVIK